MIRKTKIVVLSTMILLAISVCALTGPLPDIGQTTSYTNTFDEVSDYNIKNYLGENHGNM